MASWIPNRWRYVVLATALTAVVSLPAHSQSMMLGSGLVNESAQELDRGHWDKGVALLHKAFEAGNLSPESLPAAYNNLCIGLTGQHKFDEAFSACNSAVEMQPREWKFYNNRANIYFYLGQYDKALAEYYKALTFGAGLPILMSNIDITLRHRRDFGSEPGRPEDTEKSS